MEEISRQLRSEIGALQEYISRMEDHFLVTTWTAELLDPLRRLEDRLDPQDLQSILLLLQRVRDQFAIDGQLTPQIAALLARYPQYLAAAGQPLAALLVQDPALDPSPLGSPAEDEEQAEAEANASPPEVKPSRPVAKPAAKAQVPPPDGEESEDLSGLSMDLFSGRRKAPPPHPKEPSPSTLNFDQQQSLRQRADELGVIPRMVRRRSLVEAVYDLITSQLVLGLKLNHRTLDATASGVTASDSVCVYFSAEGIRFKELPRTTRHPAIGVCPSL